MQEEQIQFPVPFDHYEHAVNLAFQHGAGIDVRSPNPTVWSEVLLVTFVTANARATSKIGACMRVLSQPYF